MAAKNTTIMSTGRRKTSVARAAVKKGKGIIFINNETLESYIPNKLLAMKLVEPLIISGLKDKYDFILNVTGGGQNSQVEAMRTAVARALVEVTGKDDLKKTFVEYDRSLLVSDTRFKEPKKPNNSNARAKRQKSYR